MYSLFSPILRAPPGYFPWAFWINLVLLLAGTPPKFGKKYWMRTQQYSSKWKRHLEIGWDRTLSKTNVQAPYLYGYLSRILSFSVCIHIRPKVPASLVHYQLCIRIQFGATFSSSDVSLWVSKSSFTHPTIVKMAGTVRSFDQRTFYNSTCATVWTYGTNENTAVIDTVSSTDGAQKIYSLGLYE